MSYVKYFLLSCKGGRSANKLCESQTENLQTYIICYICGPSAKKTLCRLILFMTCGPKLFWDLQLPQVRKYILFLLTNIAYNDLTKICTEKSYKKMAFWIVLRPNCAVFVQICWFAICGLILKIYGFASREQDPLNFFADLRCRNCLLTSASSVEYM